MKTNKKTIVKRISNLIIISSSQGVRIVNLTDNSEEKSKIANKIPRDRKKGKIVEKILRDPTEILNLKGDVKVNLILYMLLMEENTEDFQSSKFKRTKKNEMQDFIWNLVKEKEIAWKKLRKENPRLALKFRNGFMQKSNKRDNGSLDNGSYNASYNASRYNGSYNGSHNASRYNASYNASHNASHIPHSHKENILESHLLNNNQDINKCIATGDIHSFSKNYKEMIKGVLTDNVKESLQPTNPFYPEIDILNDYLLSKYDLSLFNMDLFKRPFITINERGIRDFVKRKIEEDLFKSPDEE